MILVDSALHRDRREVRDRLQDGPQFRVDRLVVGKSEDAEHRVRPASGHDQRQVAAQGGPAGADRQDVEVGAVSCIVRAIG